MNQNSVTFHPAFIEAIRATVELDEERVKLQTVLEPCTFERVREIIERQPVEKRAAFYGTIFEAICAGRIFRGFSQ